MKKGLEKFNEISDAIKNASVLILGLLVLAYWLSYDFEVFFKEKVLNQGYWFYVGIWTKDSEYIDVQYQLHKSDYKNQKGSDSKGHNGFLTEGNVIRADAETIVGRNRPGTLEGKVRYIGGKNDCLHVLDNANFAYQANKQSSYEVKKFCGKAGVCWAIWVKAIPKMCG